MNGRRPDAEIVRLLEELIEHAKKVSPNERMTVYVGDLEGLLEYGKLNVPMKLGQNGG